MREMHVLAFPFLSLGLWVGKREGDRLRGCVYTCHHYYGVGSFWKGFKVGGSGAGSNFSTFSEELLLEVVPSIRSPIRNEQGIAS